MSPSAAAAGMSDGRSGRYGNFQRDQLSQYAGSYSLRASARPNGVSPLADGDFGAGAGLDQLAQQRQCDSDVELDCRVQRRAAERIARVRIGAAREQCAHDRDVADRDGRVQRGRVGERRAAPVRAAFEEVHRERAHRRTGLAARRGHQQSRDDAGAADRRAARGKIGERCAARGQQIDQCRREQAAIAEARVAAEPMVEQPVARFARGQLGEREIEIGERRLRPFAHDVREFGDDVPVAETQCVEQVIGVCAVRADDVAGERARQRISRVEQRDDVPAARSRGMIERALAVGRRERAIRAEREQRAHGFLVRVARLAGDDQCAAAFGVDEIRVELALAERVHDVDRAGARGFHQCGGAAMVGEVRVRAGDEQRFGDARVAGERGGHQRGAFHRAAHVRVRAMPEQRLHAVDVVVVDACGEQHGRLRARDFGFRAAVEQEIGDVPVRVHAGHAERGHAFAVDRVDIGRRIEQQRGDDRLGTARGVMQRGVAVRPGDARVGAIREQRHHRIGTSLVAVARRGDQRSEAAVCAIHVDAFCDQAAQEAKIGQRHRDQKRAALVALIRSRHGVRISAAIERGEREIDLAGACGAEQRRVEIGAVDAGGELRSAACACDGAGFHARVALARAARIDEQGAQAAIDDQQVRERNDEDCIQRERDDAEFARQVAAETGQCERTERDREQRDCGRQAVREEHVVRGRQMPRERERAAQRAEEPRAAFFARVGIVPDQRQCERGP